MNTDGTYTFVGLHDSIITGKEPQLSGQPNEKLWEAWSNVRVEVYNNIERTTEMRRVCLGVFNKEDAIKALLSFAHYNFGKESYWDGHQIIIVPYLREMLGYNGGFLWEYGVDKR